MFRTPFNASPTTETQPLLRPMASETVGSLCFMAVLSALALAWCILNQWNREVSDSLFQIGDLKQFSYNMLQTSKGIEVVPKVESPFQPYAFPLTLAFCQFLFMGLLFMGLYLTLFRESSFALSNLRLTSDWRWPLLTLTHVFGLFFLQALMLPKQALSLGLFAATRATEIPVTAALRAPICEKKVGRKTLLTAFLTTAAAAIIYFAYAQISGCLCVWTGNGVMLAGIVFWLIYLLVLALPAANFVCQEGIMVIHDVHPVLMLGLQNILASVAFIPALLGAWMMGWEDVPAAVRMILSVQEVTMLVGWLCLQMGLISLVSALLIKLCDSFWAVALQALRVVWWWLQQLWMFYHSAPGGHALLSISCPLASTWSFAMFCGCCLAAAAIYSDRKADDNIPSKTPSSSGTFAATHKSSPGDNP